MTSKVPSPQSPNREEISRVQTYCDIFKCAGPALAATVFNVSDPHEAPLLLTGGAAPALEAPIFIAPSGTYGGDQPEPALLASADASVHYPGAPSAPVKNEASINRQVRVTILNGTGAGWFRAGYLLNTQDQGFTSGGYASASLNEDTAETSAPDGLNRTGYLAARPFTYGEPQTIELRLTTAANADVRPGHPGPVDVTAHAEITRLAGFDGATNRFYSLVYQWEPL